MGIPTLVKIAITDDHSMFRQSLSAIIDSWENCKVIQQASNGKQLLEEMHPGMLPDIAIIDLNMPVLNGYETITHLRQKHPKVNILILSMYESEEMLCRLIRYGAQGFVNKSDESHRLKKAVFEIMRTGYFFTDYVGYSFFRRSVDKENKAVNFLDSQEIAFLKNICSEKTYKEISRDLGIPDRQTEYLRNRLFEKFGVKSRTALALTVIQKGLVV